MVVFSTCFTMPSGRPTTDRHFAIHPHRWVTWRSFWTCGLLDGIFFPGLGSEINILSVTELISEELYDFDDKSFLLEQAPERSLWERLGNAATMNVDSGAGTWSCLSSLHHTEHTSSNDNSEDDLNKALEVTVNSGGVVFFALFNNPKESILLPKEEAAVIKITSSRLTTLSECLGYEFARWLGVRTPQARAVHNFSSEWQTIKDAAEKACSGAASAGDEVGEMTCSELLEALEMSRCILLMNYVHGSPLLKNSQAFDSLEAAGSTASALGRILLLDLIIRNEDRLPCNQLGWRGNPGNLLFVDKTQLNWMHLMKLLVFLSKDITQQLSNLCRTIGRQTLSTCKNIYIRALLN